MRLFLIGYMGCGKTTIGKIVAQRLDLDFIDIDTHIERRYFKSIATLFREVGNEEFRAIERKSLEEISEFENVVIATGGGTPCYHNNMTLMNEKGNTFYLDFTPKHLTQRLLMTNLSKRPIIAPFKDRPKELLGFVAENLLNRMPYYQQAKYTIKGTDEEIIDKIVALFAQ